MEILNTIICSTSNLMKLCVSPGMHLYVISMNITRPFLQGFSCLIEESCSSIRQDCFPEHFLVRRSNILALQPKCPVLTSMHLLIPIWPYTASCITILLCPGHSAVNCSSSHMMAFCAIYMKMIE